MQKITVNLPEFSIEITGEHEAELIKRAAFWQSIPAACPICSAGLIFVYRNPKGFDYYELKCTGPKPHSVNFGTSNNERKTLYYDPKKPWVDFIPGRVDDAGTGPDAAVNAAQDVSGRNAGPPAINAEFQKRNELLKLMGECKRLGVVVQFSPPDVGKMDGETLDRRIYELGMHILNAKGGSERKAG